MSARYTGFADEAGKTLQEQIDVTKAAGWSSIEVRTVAGKNFCDFTDDEFNAAVDLLQAHNIQIAGYGSQIANWSRNIGSDFEVDVAELRRAIPRMQRTGTKFIRCMSYPNCGVERAAYKTEVFRRLKHLAKIAADGGVVLGHENCSGFGGEGAAQSLELLEQIDSPAFQLIFDTGNQALHENCGDANWNFYRQVRDHISHIHIKAAKPVNEKYVPCFPDEDPSQFAILQDLSARGYSGWLSIEPHMANKPNSGKYRDDAKGLYIEYARRLMELVSICQSCSSTAFR